MLEIIRQVLDAEKEAEEILQKAREDAQRIRAEFDAEEQKRLQAAQDQADAHNRQRLDQVRTEAQQRRTQTREAAQKRLQRFRNDRRTEFNEAVEDVLLILTTPIQDGPSAE